MVSFIIIKRVNRITDRGVLVLKKKKTGSVLGVMSLLAIFISIIIFYIQRGPNADIYFIIKCFGILSVAGILFAIFSWKMTEQLTFFIIGLLGNVFILICALLLLLAMGISEP